MQPHPVAKIFLGKVKAKFGQTWFELGKIKILHPQKHSISYGYVWVYHFFSGESDSGTSRRQKSHLNRL